MPVPRRRAPLRRIHRRFLFLNLIRALRLPISLVRTPWAFNRECSLVDWNPGIHPISTRRESSARSLPLVIRDFSRFPRMLDTFNRWISKMPSREFWLNLPRHSFNCNKWNNPSCRPSPWHHRSFPRLNRHPVKRISCWIWMCWRTRRLKRYSWRSWPHLFATRRTRMKCESSTSISPNRVLSFQKSFQWFTIFWTRKSTRFFLFLTMNRSWRQCNRSSIKWSLVRREMTPVNSNNNSVIFNRVDSVVCGDSLDLSPSLDRTRTMWNCLSTVSKRWSRHVSRRWTNTKMDRNIRAWEAVWWAIMEVDILRHIIITPFDIIIIIRRRLLLRVSTPISRHRCPVSRRVRPGKKSVVLSSNDFDLDSIRSPTDRDAHFFDLNDLNRPTPSQSQSNSYARSRITEKPNLI